MYMSSVSRILGVQLDLLWLTRVCLNIGYPKIQKNIINVPIFRQTLDKPT